MIPDESSKGLISMFAAVLLAISLLIFITIRKQNAKAILVHKKKQLKNIYAGTPKEV
jgi:hypothetical protein